MSDKRGSCFSRFLKILLILVIIVIIGGITAALLAIGARESYPAPKFHPGDAEITANIITRLARSLVDKEGRVVDIAKLSLSPKEVQTLLNAVVRRSNDHDLDELPYNAVWEDGRIHAHYSLDLFSGKAANFTVEVAPVVDKGNLSLVPGGGSVGHLPMPRFALNFAADKLARAAMMSTSVRTALSAFTRIEPGEDGTLLLMFDPRDVNTVVRILKSAGKAPDDAEEIDVDEYGEDDEEEDFDDREYGEDDEEEDFDDEDEEEEETF